MGSVWGVRRRALMVAAVLTLAEGTVHASAEAAAAGDEHWREAMRLGIGGEIARSRTGLAPAEQRRLGKAIVREARRHGIDPRLVAAVIQVESGFDRHAVSKRGAIGLMQLMPATGLWMAQRQARPLSEPEALFDFEHNIALGTAYLAELHRKFGTLEGALVAYNAGPGAARRILADPRARPVALEGYARRVLEQYERLLQREGPAAGREMGADQALHAPEPG